MPRQNPPRELFAERYLAVRVSQERRRREWSYEGLAERMTRAGCPIQASAIYKIEKANPPRRITVDELVAFAKVFEQPMATLVVDPTLHAPAEAVRLLDLYVAHLTKQANSYVQLTEILDELGAVLEDSPAAVEALHRRIDELYPDNPLWRETLDRLMRISTTDPADEFDIGVRLTRPAAAKRRRSPSRKKGPS